MTHHTLHLGDCLEVMRTMADCSVDAVVTDPPYGLSFMGKRWDYDVPSVEIWAECLRVLKPGGHLLAFAGTRTQHRMACRIEDAGFEIRDLIMYCYGSGFPKSLDISKAIDKCNGEANRLHKFTAWMREQGMTIAIMWGPLLPFAKNEATAKAMAQHYISSGQQPAIPTSAIWRVLRPLCANVPAWVDELVQRIEAEREVVGQAIGTDTAKARLGMPGQDNQRREYDITAPATPEAQQWAGWGTALKPSFESVTWATKPVDPMGYCAIILENLTELEAQCLQIANAAASSSRPTQAGSPEAKIGFAQEPAATQHEGEQERKTATGAAGATSSPVDTSASTLAAASIAWSIASSWRHTLEGVYARGRTSTTETESKTTTDWKTLSCCLSQITPESIIQACSLPGGFSANASTAAQIFNASLASLQSTLTLSAIEPATWQALDGSLAEAVKPNVDPVVMARKPLAGTVAANVLQHGTGALNVDGCRVAVDPNDPVHSAVWHCKPQTVYGQYADHREGVTRSAAPPAAGRWPANLITDGSDEVVGLFPEGHPHHSGFIRQGGDHFSVGSDRKARGTEFAAPCDTGSAARFFYTSKATKAERQGCTHPTVKPLDLMAYLCRLVTPPGGTVLDPFMGSGTTIKAALSEGFNAIGIERDPAYFAMAEHRMNGAQLGLSLTTP